jgi:hypothetical protein
MTTRTWTPPQPTTLSNVAYGPMPVRPDDTINDDKQMSVELTQPPQRTPMASRKRVTKRPPAIPTPMRKELGSPRKRNCVADGTVVEPPEGASHPNTRSRSSPQLFQETVTMENARHDTTPVPGTDPDL